MKSVLESVVKSASLKGTGYAAARKRLFCGPGDPVGNVLPQMRKDT